MRKETKQCKKWCIMMNTFCVCLHFLGRIACMECKGAAYCYRGSVVCVSVPYVVWNVDSGWCTKPCIK